MKLKTNILILGKTGVGKSSFLNYIYGEKVADYRAGKPVTEYGLEEYVYEENGIIYTIYDSWGLEPNKATKWEELIMSELEKRDYGRSIKEWFHTIYYCFSASTARVEDFEIDYILRPLIKSGNHVCVIFTHADVPKADEQIKKMKQYLEGQLGSGLTTINVSNEKKTLLSGKVVEPFGKREVMQHIKDNLWKSIKNKLPTQFDSYVNKSLDQWNNENLSFIDEYKLFGPVRTLEQVNTFIESNLKGYIANIYEELNKNLYEAMEYYFQIMGHVMPYEKNDIDSLLENLSKNLETKKWIPETENWLLNIMEKNRFFEFAAFFHARRFVKLNMKKRVKKLHQQFKKESVPQIIHYYNDQIAYIEEEFERLTKGKTP